MKRDQPAMKLLICHNTILLKICDFKQSKEVNYSSINVFCLDHRFVPRIAVISYGQKDYATAAEFFKRAIKASPGSPSEADFADFMRSEAKRGLAKAQEMI